MITDTVLDRGAEIPLSHEVHGIGFSVTVRGVVCPCMVTRDALLFIARMDRPGIDLLSLFHRHEFRIYRVARSMAGMGFKGTPLVLNPWTFRIDALTFKNKPPLI